ncbi:MAG: tetratricopeptide repeat protein [Candidatus Melainabacteria bacterium]|nr:tetratricopeptide repeat protein [Candidatus Melainabacteria bacterium]
MLNNKITSKITAFNLYLWVPAFIAICLYYPILFNALAVTANIDPSQPYSRNFILLLKSLFYKFPEQIFAPFYYFQSCLINNIFGIQNANLVFHLYSIILLCISGIVITLILQEITKNNLLSVGISLIWICHPLNIKTIAFIENAPGVLASTTFGLLFIYYSLRFYRRNQKRDLVIGSLFFFLSLGSHEQLFLLPIILFFVIILFPKEQPISKNKLYFLFSITSLVVILYYLWKYLSCGNSIWENSETFIRWSNIGHLKDILFRLLWLLPQLLVHYIKLFFFPNFNTESQIAFYKVGDNVFSLYPILCQIICLVLIIGSCLLIKKLPLFTLGIFWFFITFFPVLQVIPLAHIVDSTYIYMPGLGLVIASFSLFIFLNKKLLMILSITLCLILFGRTSSYINIFKSPVSYLTAEVKYAPKICKPFFLIKLILTADNLRQNDMLPAWVNYTAIKSSVENWLKENIDKKVTLAARFGPIQDLVYYDTLNVISSYLLENKRYSELNKIRAKASLIKNNYIGFFLDSVVLVNNNYITEAWLQLKEAIKLNPGFRSLYEAIFVKTAYGTQNFHEAEILLQNYLKLKSEYAHPYLCTGLFYSYNTLAKDAADSFLKQAIHINKKSCIDDISLFLQAIDFFKEKNDVAAIKDTCKIIAKIDPYNPLSYFELAKIYYDNGNYKLALTLMKEAIKVAPGLLDD